MTNKYKDKKVFLKTIQVEPFSGGLCDWYGKNGEAVVTFITMKKYLYYKWEEKCVSRDHSVCDHEGKGYPDLVPAEKEGYWKLPDSCHPKRIVDHSQFNLSDIKGPGVYLDSTHYYEEDSVDECYTVIIPFGVLNKNYCEDGLKELNKKFDRDFELEIGDENGKNMD